MISVLKVIAATSVTSGIQESQLSCGGLGYSQYAGFSKFYNDNTIQNIWEGDNKVLLQQTGKYLLDSYKAKMQGKEGKPSVTCEWISVEPVDG